MNNDVLKGNWNQMKGQVKEWWGDLTDDDMSKIDGQKDKLIGRLQERYGYTRERAESEVNQKLDEWQRGARHTMDKMNDKMDETRGKLNDKMNKGR